MSWVISPSYKDPDFASVSLLLHGNGTNGSTTITDNSPTPKTVTAVSNAQISTTQSKFGGASIAFDGTGDRLEATSNDFNLASDNFTWEGWFYINNASENTTRIFVCNYDSYGSNSIFWGKHTAASGRVAVFVANSSGSPLISESTLPPSTSWTHYALVRSGNTLTMYRDGLQTASAALTGSVTNQNLLRVGGSLDGLGFTLNGYIDDLRITKSARYTSNFSVPPAQFPDI
jgi:hypothetical protein